MKTKRLKTMLEKTEKKIMQVTIFLSFLKKNILPYQRCFGEPILSNFMKLLSETPTNFMVGNLLTIFKNILLSFSPTTVDCIGCIEV